MSEDHKRNKLSEMEESCSEQPFDDENASMHDTSVCQKEVQSTEITEITP